MVACRARASSDVNSVNSLNAYVNGKNVDDDDVDVDGDVETRGLKIANVDVETRGLKSADGVDLEILAVDGNDAILANTVDGANGAALANLISDVDLTEFLQSDAFVPMRFHDDCGDGSYLLCDDD